MANVTNAQTSSRQLEHIAENAQDILIRVETVFPFTLFPTTITMDRVKITVKRRSFFNASQVTSIQIDDILNVEATSGPFLGSVKFWSRFLPNEPQNPQISVGNLKNRDALAIKRLLQGYIIARHKEVDCSQIERRELIKMLNELGREATGV